MTSPLPGDGVSGQRFVLPFPPSSNNLFATVGHRRVRSAGYARWAREAGLTLLAQKARKTIGSVVVEVDLKAPDMRRRDADNGLKAIMDLLVSHQLIEADDNRVVKEVRARWVSAGEPCVVTVRSASA